MLPWTVRRYPIGLALGRRALRPRRVLLSAPSDCSLCPMVPVALCTPGSSCLGMSIDAENEQLSRSPADTAVMASCIGVGADGNDKPSAPSSLVASLVLIAPGPPSSRGSAPRPPLVPPLPLAARLSRRARSARRPTGRRFWHTPRSHLVIRSSSRGAGRRWRRTSYCLAEGLLLFDAARNSTLALGFDVCGCVSPRESTNLSGTCSLRSKSWQKTELMNRASVL